MPGGQAAAGDELNAYLWREEDGDGAAIAVERPSVAPVAVKDIFCTEGVPTTAGSRILEGYRPPYTATAVTRLARGRRPDPRQDQHGRVRDGLLQRELGLRPGAQPLGPRSRSRRLLGRLGRRGRRRPRALGDRHRHRRLDPPARRALRHRRAQAHLRRDLALRDDRLRLLAGPVRTAHPRRQRRRPDAGDAAGRRSLRLDLGRPAQIAEPARPRGPRRPALRRPARTGQRRDRARRARGLRGDPGEDRAARRRGRRDRRCRTPNTASPPTT